MTSTLESPTIITYRGYQVCREANGTFTILHNDEIIHRGCVCFMTARDEIDSYVVWSVR